MFENSKNPVIGVIMGSKSDLTIMVKAVNVLKKANVPFEVQVVSAHRTPENVEEYAKTARERGLKVIIAGAGGAAHLPGMIAASTSLPVIGVPINSSNSIKGVDSLLAIVQMPKGVPVLTMAIDGAENAALAAIQILGTSQRRYGTYMDEYKKILKSDVKKMNDELPAAITEELKKLMAK